MKLRRTVLQVCQSRFITAICTLCVLVLGQGGYATQPEGDEIEPVDPWETLLQHVTTASHPPLNEISGIIRSQTYPDVWWVHNDSGDVPRLFAINAQGQPIMPGWLENTYYAQEFLEGKQPWPGIPILNSANVDWEDIAIADGKLYIADVGNNGNARRDLGVYVLNEPNPRAIDRAKPTKFIPIRYPDQDSYPPADWNFDCEAVFVHSGKLYFLTKYRADRRWDKITYGTSLYRLDTAHTDTENELSLVSRLDDLRIVPTAADLSTDGRRLAVLSYDGVWVFQAPDAVDGTEVIGAADSSNHSPDSPVPSDGWLDGQVHRVELPPHQLKQAEAICWDDDNTLRITNEQRDIFTLDAGLLKPVE